MQRHLSRLVGDIRIFNGVQKVWRTKMVITLTVAGIHGCGIDHHVHAAGLLVLVHRDRPAGLAKTPVHGRETQVVDRKVWKSVVGIDLVRLRLG